MSRVLQKDWMELEFSHESLLNGNKEVIQFRECVNSSRLEVLVIRKKDQAICPAIVICLGGPIIPMPDFWMKVPYTAISLSKALH